MGEVYLAHDTRLDRRFAIKLLPAHLAADVVARERLRREALDHPFICKIFGVARKQSWPPRLTASTATPSPASDARGYLWHRPKKFSNTCLATLRPTWSPWRIECRQCRPAQTRASSIWRMSAFRS
jgi:serine/threonine protein kinase